MQFDILAWVIGVPLIVLSVVSLFLLHRQARTLKEDLSHLNKIKRHTIEYELVLKTMKLSIWRLDIPTLSLTFESDYRDSIDTVVLPPGATFDMLCSIMLPVYVEKLKKKLAELIEGKVNESHLQYEIKIPHSDSTYWEEIYAIVDKRDLDGKPLSIVGTSMRIDKQKEMEKSLIDARNHAEESDRLKSAFLANISHEIRTPLNAIVGFSDVLPMAQSVEEREQLIGLIKQNNAQLLRLFDDMVHMSKLEAGEDAVKKTRFPLKVLMEEIINKFASKVDDSRITIGMYTTDEMVEPYTDRERLREILCQYMDNAIKFTTDGSITLGYEVVDNILRVSVKDTGKGIPANLCNEHLFERFVKVDEFVPGTGLGLSICRSMAMSLGGRVGAQSKYGEGSSFWVEIPLN